jgi:hypothetical protein
MRPNPQVKYVTADGRLTLEGIALLERLAKVSGDRLAAIAGVTKPTGGATEDAEARAAIDAIIDAAQ